VVNTRDVTDKKNLQDKLAQELEERRATINKAAIKAQEREREQLGRELHDNVNQVLTTIKLYTELALDSTVDAKLLMQKSVAYLTDCINEIRSISKRLSTPTLGKISFRESLEELVNSLSLTEKLTIDLHIGRLEKKKLNQDTHLGIYRIVQEHLTNVLRHARATTVAIAVESKQGELQILITDDGIGFDVKAKRKGIGISNMYGRSENINGRLELTSAPGKGCTLRLCVPL
jgi:signal transduction histidine kinase